MKRKRLKGLLNSTARLEGIGELGGKKSLFEGVLDFSEETCKEPLKR